jgi:putative DNA primase/helicase
MHAGRLRYIAEEKRWLEFRDGRWRRDVTGAAEGAAVRPVEAFWHQLATLPDEQRERAAKWGIASQSARAIAAMLKLASTDAGIAVSLTQLDTHPYLLSCGNGTLDLRSGKLRDPDPAELISLGTDVNFHAGAPAPRWELFLSEVFDGDHELIAFMQRAKGSCITGDTRDRALFVEQGSLRRAVRAILRANLGGE